MRASYSLPLLLFLSHQFLAVAAKAEFNNPVTLRGVSDEVFGDTGGSSGDEMVNDWKREVVEAAISSSASVAAAAAASSSSTGFSKVVRATSTLTNVAATPVTSNAPAAAQTSEAVAPVGTTTASFMNTLYGMSSATKLGLSISAGLVGLFLIVMISLIVRHYRSSRHEGEDRLGELPSKEFTDRATSLPIRAQRRKSYRMFTE